MKSRIIFATMALLMATSAFADPLIGDVNNSVNQASQNSAINTIGNLTNRQDVNSNSYTYNPTNTNANTNLNTNANNSSANGNLNQQSNFGNSSVGNVTGGNASTGAITNTNTANGGAGGQGGQGGQGGAGGSVLGSGNSSSVSTGGSVVGSGNSAVQTNVLAGNNNGNLSNVGNASQGQGQEQTQNTVAGNNNGNGNGNANGNNNGNVSINVAAPKTYRPPVSSAIAPTVFPTAPCMGSSSGAATGTLISISGGTSWESKECMILEAARNFEQSGARVDAMYVRCQSKYAAAAPSCKALARGDDLKLENGELVWTAPEAQTTAAKATVKQIEVEIGTNTNTQQYSFLGINQ